MRAKPTEHLNLLGFGLTIAAILAVSFFVDVETMKEHIANAGVWAPLLFILLKASTVIVAPLSGGPLYPVVGLLFGFWPGIAYVALGDLLGMTGAFIISRRLGFPVVRKIIKKDEHGMLSKIVRHVGTTKGFIHMCITCFALPELVAYGAGLSKLPYWKFILFWPFYTVASSLFVLFGSLLGEGDHPLLLTLAAPLVGGVIVVIGLLLFMRGVGKEDPKED